MIDDGDEEFCSDNLVDQKKKTKGGNDNGENDANMEKPRSLKPRSLMAKIEEDNTI